MQRVALGAVISTYRLVAVLRWPTLIVLFTGPDRVRRLHPRGPDLPMGERDASVADELGATAPPSCPR